jgi:hypothetical protein
MEVTPIKEIFANDPLKGRVKAGLLVSKDDKLYFLKKVKRSKHFFKIIDGYAIQRDLFLKLKVAGIFIKEEDTNDLYYASYKMWILHGSNWTGKNGNQQTLSIKYMTKVSREKK